MYRPALLQAAGTGWPASLGTVAFRETDLQIVISCVISTDGLHTSGQEKTKKGYGKREGVKQAV